jgi:hypothetical protein
LNWPRRRRGRCGFFLAPQNLAHRVAWLRDLRPVDLRLLSIAGGTLLSFRAPAAALQIGSHTLGFVAFERT